MAREGNLPERDMFNTFNMGVGMCLVVDKADGMQALSILHDMKEDAYAMGQIADGPQEVLIK